MSDRIEAFLRDLPARDVPETLVPAYRAVLEAFEASLPQDARARFGEEDIRRHLVVRRNGGATDRQLRNVETACRSYMEWSREREGGLELDLSNVPARAPVADGQLPPESAVPPEAAPSAGFGEAATPGGRRSGPPSGVAGRSTGPLAAAAAPGTPSRIDAKRVALVAAGLVAVALLVAGGCVLDRVGQIRRVGEFADAVLFEARKVTVPDDEEPLRARVLEVARASEMEVAPAGVTVDVTLMTPSRTARLPQAERMALVEAMQRRAASGGRATLDLSYYFVEVIVGGESRGTFGSQRFDFTHHVAVGGGMPEARAAVGAAPSP